MGHPRSSQVTCISRYDSDLLLAVTKSVSKGGSQCVRTGRRSPRRSNMRRLDRVCSVCCLRFLGCGALTSKVWGTNLTQVLRAVPSHSAQRVLEALRAFGSSQASEERSLLHARKPRGPDPDRDPPGGRQVLGMDFQGVVPVARPWD